MAGFDEATDATRRTRLANERTYLAWWRSGLTALAVAFGAGKLAPDLGGGTRWPSEAVGVGAGVLGVAFIAYGFYRQRAVEAALRRGEFAGVDERLTLAFAAAGVVLGISIVLVVLFAA